MATFWEIAVRSVLIVFCLFVIFIYFPFWFESGICSLLTKFLLNNFGVGVSCRNLYSFVVYLYVTGSGSITSVGEERANLSAVVYL